MAIIMVPVMAAFENELKLNLSLLEEIALSKGHEIGIEVIGKPKHFLERKGREKIIDNLVKYAAGLKIVSHQWSGNVIYDTAPDNLAWSDLRTERGSRCLESGVAFAHEVIDIGLVGEVYVHTHGGDLYFGERMPEWDLQKDKRKIKEKLLLASKKNNRIKIGLENLAEFPNSDEHLLVHAPHKIGRSVFEKLGDYRELVEGSDLGLTFDTAHFTYELQYGEIDLCSAVDIFGDHLMHVHINDSRGYWIPHQSVAGDGYIPGEGKIGKKEFQRFFKYLRDKYDLSRIGIEAEVKDTNYGNPINRREAVRRIVEWLD